MEKNDKKEEWLVHTGVRLNEAMKLSMREDLQNRVGELEKIYLKAALDEEESNRREQEEQQKREQALKDQSERRKTWIMRISIAVCVLSNTLGAFAVIAYLIADEESAHARNLLAKNYWSNALDAKEKKRWLKFLHYGAQTGKLAINRSYANNVVFDINNTLTFYLNAILKHGDRINRAVFNRNETQILTWSDDGTARLWDMEVDEDFPKKHLTLMVKVATGTSMDDYGNVVNLSKSDWEEYKAAYIRVAEEHLNSCKHRNANIYLKYQKNLG